jgi:shikimate dehydrogenase
MMEEIVLIGSNISHSRSPRLHNYLFEKFDLPYRYRLMPLERDELPDALDQMKSGGFRGANVTSPYKQLVRDGIDRLSEEATIIGAVNTILFEDGDAIGFNTDTYGVAQAIREHALTGSAFDAAVIGTGGAAASAVYALLAEPELRHLTIYSRSLERAAGEAARWNDARVSGDCLDRFLPSDLVIHATPVGLAGDGDALLSESQLNGVRVLFEMIYSPAETELVRRARRAGADIIPGMSMFLHQALRSFQLWTGIMVSINDIPNTLFESSTTT